MLKILLKKQLMEVFKGYFYDAKKNKKRSTGAVIAYFVLFVFLMVGIMGGMFTFLSLSLCGALTMVGVEWLFFIIMSGIAILFGAFGSVFNTFAGLYLSKDNDLLLSMPIPVKYIIISRLLNVYLLGTMYSGITILPAIIVYWIVKGLTISNFICGILLFVIISVIVLILSCLLGWVVAKISVKLKRKSFMTVFISLAFIAAYYFFYFKAQTIITDLIANAEIVGEQIKGAAYGLYMFGNIATGDWLSTLVYVLGVTLVGLLTWFILRKTFLSIAIATGNAEKVKYKETIIKERSQFKAILAKEFAKFTSSATYMLNAALSSVMIPIAAIALLIKSGDLLALFASAEADGAGNFITFAGCALLCFLSTMNFITAPSISLEAKNLWIYQSLPIHPKKVLRAKALVHILVTGIPMLFAVICVAVVLPIGLIEKLFVCILPLIVVVFFALFGLIVGIKMPNLTWTNEIVPIKQGGSVVVAMFGGMGIIAVFAVPYFFIDKLVSLPIYLGIWTIIFAIATIVLLRWIDTKGAKIFSNL